MGVSFRQLREKCQLPVRSGNDVAGLVFGDRVSLPITKFFVDTGLTPDIATIGFLVSGLTGAALQTIGPACAAAGAFLLVLYYVLDCVDGEVARFRGIEDMRWGYYDYVFHMLVKPSAFVGVAVGCWRAGGHPLLLLAGAAAGVTVLWLKLFLEIPGILFLRGVLAGSPGGNRAFRRYLRSLTWHPASRGEVGAPLRAPSGPEAVVLHAPSAGEGAALHGRPAAQAAAAERGAAVTAGAQGAAVAPSRPGFRLGFDLVTLRALLTNFDLGLVYLLCATLIDLWRGPFDVPVLGPMSARALWLTYYACVLPLDFLDHVQTYLRRGHFAHETTRLLTLAHHYRFELPPDEALPAAAPPAQGEGAAAQGASAQGTGAQGAGVRKTGAQETAAH
ncbi:MAG TPA: hypothetical protein VK824_10420 [Planctomycetota bacterium]|nr:hypothetical protein [Planctomycetota bacterium]